MNLRSLLVVAMMLMTAGCGHLDLSTPASEDRVLNGMVTYDLETALPDDTTIVVKVIDASDPTGPMNVLGETTITHPGVPPVPFHVEYRATDELLMHHVMVDVRISFGGKLRYHTVGGHPVTFGNVGDTHVVHAVPMN